MPVMTKSPKGDDIVILSRKEYDRVLAAADEDAVDAAIAKKAITRNEETLSEAEVNELLAARTPLAFWCKKRGLTQTELAKAAGIAQGFLSEIESGLRQETSRFFSGLRSLLRFRFSNLRRTLLQVGASRALNSKLPGAENNG
jgi:hypothetical protein